MKADGVEYASLMIIAVRVLTLSSNGKVVKGKR